MSRYGGIEFGGTKTVCVVGQRGRIDEEVRFPTGNRPLETVRACLQFLTGQGHLAGVGIGSFGPCDPDPASPGYGCITTTPKPGWSGFDVLRTLRSGLPDTHMAFDTDVNAAALGEWVHGAGRGVESLVYITVGTGIGAGIVARSGLIHGLQHPEAGHMLIPRPEAERRRFTGVCPYHRDCWEGLASGPAMHARWGRPPQEIPEDGEDYAKMWDLEADYVAAGLHNIVCTVSPQRIILGGGVGQQAALLSRVKPRLQVSLAGYVTHSALSESIDAYIVAPGLGARAGGIGAIELAARAHEHAA